MKNCNHPISILTIASIELIKMSLLIMCTFLSLNCLAQSARDLSGKEQAYVSDAVTVQTHSDVTGIKDELEDQSLKEILAGVLVIKEGKIEKIIKFLSSTSHGIWIIREGALHESINGQTQLTASGVLTILDFDKLRDGTNISVARTVIHEMIHAYLTLYFRYDAINANRDYPAILNAWTTTKHPDYNKIQHDEIERSFISDISLALDEYAKIAGLNNIDEQIYNDLAWADWILKTARS